MRFLTFHCHTSEYFHNGHTGDFKLLPIKEFWIFSIIQNIYIFFNLLYRKEEI